MKITYLFTLLLSGIFSLLFLLGCADNFTESKIESNMGTQTFIAVTTEGQTMGTYWSVKVYTTDPSLNSSRIHSMIQAKLDYIDSLMSTYKADSEVSRFNRSDSTDWFELSPETVAVIEQSLEVSRLSKGAFDITVGPLVNLWRFGPDRSPLLRLPQDEEVAGILNRIGYDKLECRREPTGAVRKTISSLAIDLSAIAKGFAVDQAAQTLLEAGIDRFLVDVGGEIVCHGQKPLSPAQNSPWILGIEAPGVQKTDEPTVYRKLTLEDCALATSGDYRNYLEVEGVRFSHLIDPRTGYPKEMLHLDETSDHDHLASVSVIAENCATGDAWATAFFVLGADEGLEIAKQLGMTVIFLLRDRDNPERLYDIQ